MVHIINLNSHRLKMFIIWNEPSDIKHYSNVNFSLDSPSLPSISDTGSESQVVKIVICFLILILCYPLNAFLDSIAAIAILLLCMEVGQK